MLIVKKLQGNQEKNQMTQMMIGVEKVRMTLMMMEVEEKDPMTRMIAVEEEKREEKAMMMMIKLYSYFN